MYKSYLRGVKKTIPVMFGYLPVAITFSITAMSGGMSALQAIFMSVFVFAGAAQMMAAQMFAGGAGVLTIVLGTFILNLRHLIMSTCVFGKIKKSPFLFKVFGSFGVTDELFALFMTEPEDRADKPFFLGVMTGTYLSWVGGTVIGALATGIMPEILAKSFSVAFYALFVSLIAPDVIKSLRLALLVIMTAGVNFFLQIFISPNWAIIISTVVCALAGVFFIGDEKGGEAEMTEKRSQERSEEQADEPSKAGAAV